MYALIRVFVLILVFYIKIDMESLGKIVSSDFFCITYQYFHSSKISVLVVLCRSPPVDTSFSNLYWLEVFVMSGKKDIILGKFIKYMDKALYCRKVDYFRAISKINENEMELNESLNYELENKNNFFIDFNILNQKEKYLLELHYNRGLSYTEISKITNEKICTLKQRRNRAVEKLKRKMGGIGYGK